MFCRHIFECAYFINLSSEWKLCFVELRVEFFERGDDGVDLDRGRGLNGRESR
jgi:hypothetical protein